MYARGAVQLLLELSRDDDQDVKRCCAVGLASVGQYILKLETEEQDNRNCALVGSDDQCVAMAAAAAKSALDSSTPLSMLEPWLNKTKDERVQRLVDEAVERIL